MKPRIFILSFFLTVPVGFGSLSDGSHSFGSLSDGSHGFGSWGPG